MSEATVPESASGGHLAAPAGPLRLLSDERLARRAAKGDRRAFEQIYRRFHQDLYRFCLALTGNPQDAQDSLQNTMVKVLGALPGEQRRINLKPWLYRIAHNESMESIRRRRDHAELEPEQVTSTVEIATTAEARERLRGLIADLDELPERQRGALVMREMAGLGFEQIADSFGTSAAVARQTVYEARLSLRQMEAGREMSCDEVTRQLSDGDGRVGRRREIRSHLRGCAGCRAFRDAIDERRAGFAAIAPLPVAAAAGLLYGGAATASASGGAAGVGGVAGAGVAGSAVAKTVAAVAIVAVGGVAVAERSGVVDLPLPGNSSSEPALESPGNGPAGKGSGSSTATPGRDGSAAAGKGGSRAGGAANGGRRGNSANRSSRGKGKAKRGHGRHRGRPEGLPSASTRGQETAGAHKAAPAPASPPGPGGSAPQSEKSAPAPPSSSAKPSPSSSGGEPGSPSASAPETSSSPSPGGRGSGRGGGPP